MSAEPDPRGRRAAAERDGRRAEALVANLKRRKAQQRGRDATDTPDTQSSAPPAGNGESR